jgi:hypothetical protein
VESKYNVSKVCQKIPLWNLVCMTCFHKTEIRPTDAALYVTLVIVSCVTSVSAMSGIL